MDGGALIASVMDMEIRIHKSCNTGMKIGVLLVSIAGMDKEASTLSVL
jgi:hypothetical protein